MTTDLPSFAREQAEDLLWVVRAEAEPDGARRPRTGAELKTPSARLIMGAK